jgi:hypothetical protein
MTSLKELSHLDGTSQGLNGIVKGWSHGALIALLNSLLNLSSLEKRLKPYLSQSGWTLAKVGRLWIINGRATLRAVRSGFGNQLSLIEALAMLYSRGRSISGSSLLVF